MSNSSALFLEASATGSATDCGCIAGSPELPVGSEWPVCRICGDDLVLFFDIRLPDSTTSRFLPSSRLQLFTCREHSDICGTPYSDYAPFQQMDLVERLPPAYWDVSDGHYLLRLLPPTQPTAPGKPEPRLEKKFLSARDSGDANLNGIQLFGEPHWLQDSQAHTCACGAPMDLLLQVDADVGFQMMPDAPAQEDSFSHTQYCLFLGNQLFLLACTAQCDPQALWPILQN